MATINISLPEKLKEQAQLLVKAGVYSSFSDLVRDSVRSVVSKNKYDILFEEAKKDLKGGKATVLKSKEDIKKFFETL